MAAEVHGDQPQLGKLLGQHRPAPAVPGDAVQRDDRPTVVRAEEVDVESAHPSDPAGRGRRCARGRRRARPGAAAGAPSSD